MIGILILNLTLRYLLNGGRYTVESKTYIIPGIGWISKMFSTPIEKNIMKRIQLYGFQSCVLLSVKFFTILFF